MLVSFAITAAGAVPYRDRNKSSRTLSIVHFNLEISEDILRNMLRFIFFTDFKYLKPILYIQVIVLTVLINNCQNCIIRLRLILAISLGH